MGEDLVDQILDLLNGLRRDASRQVGTAGLPCPHLEPAFACFSEPVNEPTLQARRKVRGGLDCLVVERGCQPV